MNVLFGHGHGSATGFTNYFQHAEVADTARYIDAISQRITGLCRGGVIGTVFISGNQGLGGFGLYTDNPRAQVVDQAEVLQLFPGLPHAEHAGAATGGVDHDIRQAPGVTGVLGMWKGWKELENLGLIDHMRPKVICVQAEATQPLVIAYENGANDTTPAKPGETLAYGVNVPGGVGHFRVLEIIRESGGAAVAVAEQDIQTTLSQIYRDKGWSICPEGAACLAALPQLLENGLLNPGDKVVVFNTGSLEKYLPDLQHLL